MPPTPCVTRIRQSNSAAGNTGVSWLEAIVGLGLVPIRRLGVVGRVRLLLQGRFVALVAQVIILSAKTVWLLRYQRSQHFRRSRVARGCGRMSCWPTQRRRTCRRFGSIESQFQETLPDDLVHLLVLPIRLARKSGEHQLRNQEVFCGEWDQTDAGVSA